jgi:hypothetical protein
MIFPDVNCYTSTCLWSILVHSVGEIGNVDKIN